MIVDLVLRNCKVLLDGKLTLVDVGISAGKIQFLKTAGTEAIEAGETIDCGGDLVVPGAIDAHVHVGDPLYRHHDDFETASRCALIGGVTTFVEMPLVKPICDVSSLRERVEDGEAMSLVDFAIHGGFLNRECAERMKELLGAGVASMKLFTAPPYSPPESDIPELLARAASLGALVNVHAEDGDLVAYMEREFKARGKREPIDFHLSRPAECEWGAVARTTAMARLLGASLHFSHISSAEGLERVRAAKRAKQDVTAETCPHYLVFTVRDVEKHGPYLKLTPSLKREEDKEALWKGIREGVIDAVTSDHAPSTREEKEVGWDDIWEAWCGVPGLGLTLPILIEFGYFRRGIPLDAVLKVTSSLPAERFGLSHRKGAIEPGRDADLVVLDLDTAKEVDGAIYKVGWSPYGGMRLRGFPRLVLLRGEVAYQDGEVLLKRGFGNFIRARR